MVLHPFLQTLETVAQLERSGAPTIVAGRDMNAALPEFCTKPDLSTRQFPEGLEKVRLTRENRTRLPMSWPS